MGKEEKNQSKLFIVQLNTCTVHEVKKTAENEENPN